MSELWLLGLTQENEMETHLGLYPTLDSAKKAGDGYIEMQGIPLSNWSSIGWSDQSPLHPKRFVFRELGRVDDLPPYDSIYVSQIEVKAG